MLDAIVIGAGVSGLRTAGLLNAAGRSVAVLEARDRVGGRLRSVDQNSGALDLGATWFWANEKHITSLISELGIETHQQHLAGDAIYHDPAGSRRIDGNPIDVPAGRFSNGAQQLATRLAARLPDGVLQVRSVVDAIVATPEALRVSTASSSLDANHVVIAVPPALAAHSISIDPPLPDALSELARQTPVWMGSVVKVVVSYPTAFWRDQGFAGAAISHVGPLRELHDMSGSGGQPAALFGFAPMTRPDSPTPTESDVTAQLVEMFGPEAAATTSVHIEDWRAEKHTSPPLVELLRDYGTYGHPAWDTPVLEGRLHWASTETSPVNPGHIDGALARAGKIASRIISSF